MYLPIKDGSVENIQGYDCQIPPEGYGKNRLTGKIEHIGIVKRSHKKEEQYWERITLPSTWDKKRKEEILKQKEDEDYYDPELERVRLQHWKYRLCGLWVMINGKATYLPPSYFIYINWCPLDVGYPEYRDTDRKFYYVWEYCCEDPRCAGLADIERRRMGKTFKSGSILLDRASIYKNHHGGIQSKTASDSKGVFLKTVVTFFKKFPDFFRPVYDQSKGITPTSELKFFQTTIKGRRAEKILDREELESWIDHGSADIYHYDGTKLNTYVMDEFGKTVECSVWDRWNVVRFCLDQDGAWCGKALLTSTIEEMEGGNTDAFRIWQASDPSKRDANGRTESGLYRFFLPAYETTFFDKFGMPQTEKAKVFYMNQRAGLQNDPRALSSVIRKAPFKIEEAFRIDATRCLYNPEALNDRYDWLLWHDNIVERGNFVWKDGIRLVVDENGELKINEVVWERNKNGRWLINKLLDPKEANRVARINGEYIPQAIHERVAGADPFRYDKTKDSRRSDCAAHVYDKVLNRFICEYAYRAATVDMADEDILKMAWYYGCQVNFERNVDHWMGYFKNSHCYKFLLKLPGEDLPGTYTDGHGSVTQQICELTEHHIENHINEVDFKELVKDWLEFKVEETTKFDRAMSAGMALIGAQYKKYYKKPTAATHDIGSYVRQYEAV